MKNKSTLIGQILKKQRLRMGLSATDLAQKSNYSKSYICDLEKNRKIPSKETCSKLFLAMGLDYDRYLTFNDELNDNFNKIIEFIVEGDTESYSKLMMKLNEEILKLELSLYYHDYVLFKFIFQLLNKEDVKRLFDEVKSYFEKEYYINERQQICLLYFGVYYRNQGDLLEAKKQYSQSLLAQYTEDITALTYYHFAIVNEKERNYFEAYENNKKAQAIFIKHLYLKRSVFIESHIGVLYAKLHCYEYADRTFNTVLKEATKYNIKDTLNVVANNLVWNAVLWKKYDKAFAYYTTYKHLYSKNAHNYLALAWITYKLNKNDISISFIQLGKNLEDNVELSMLAFEVLECSLLDKTVDEINIKEILVKEYGSNEMFLQLLFILEEYYERKSMYKKALYIQKKISSF